MCGPPAQGRRADTHIPLRRGEGETLSQGFVSELDVAGLRLEPGGNQGDGCTGVRRDHQTGIRGIGLGRFEIGGVDVNGIHQAIFGGRVQGKTGGGNCGDRSPGVRANGSAFPIVEGNGGLGT